MNELIEKLIRHWPEVTSCVLTGIGYFLIFLYRLKFGKTTNTLGTLFEDKVVQVDSKTNNTKREILIEMEQLRKENSDIRKEYNRVMLEYAEYSKRMNRVEQALLYLTEEEEDTNDKQ